MDRQITYRNMTIAYRTEVPIEPGLPDTPGLPKGDASIPTLLLVHGFAEDGGIWDNQLAYLKSKVRLIIPDLPGCGHSDPLTGDISMEDGAELLLSILDHEKIGQCVMIGHSMGGYITLAFAEKYPHRLTAAGLFHSTAYGDTDEKKGVRRKCIEFIRNNGAAPFIRQSTPGLFAESTRQQRPELVSWLTEKYIDLEPASLIAWYEAMIKRPDRTKVLQHFSGPFLFIIGQQDNAVPIATVLPQTYMPALAYIHILQDAGHAGMLESADHSNRILDEFLHDNHIYHE